MHYQAPGVELVGRPARIAAENVWLDAFTENDIHTTGRYVDGDEIVDFAVMTGVHSGPRTAARRRGPATDRPADVRGLRGALPDR